jgi:ribosomal protein L11 methyltransferase
MYSLHLICLKAEAERLSLALWEAGTVRIREEEGPQRIELIAGFDDSAARDVLSRAFASYQPVWEREEEVDWVAATQEAWPARAVGERIFLAPVWNADITPSARVRVIHNPGMASGTGEHPCTQLALQSLERCVSPGSLVVDLGTGSGILSLAALRLGARLAAALDLDLASLDSAHENFALNGFLATLAAGSADCVASEVADIVVANVSGTVLLSVADELLRIVRPGGWLIITGFPESELKILRQAFGDGAVTDLNEWRCLTLACSLFSSQCQPCC